jgi:hypothetical protein
MAEKYRYLQCNAECKIRNGTSSGKYKQMGFHDRFKFGQLIIYIVEQISNSNLTAGKYISEMSVERAHAVFQQARRFI